MTNLQARASFPSVPVQIAAMLGGPVIWVVYFLIVCAVGGTSSITGPLVAALVLGIADVFGKYYVPQLGAFVVYLLMVVILVWRPQGLFGRAAVR